MPRPGVTVEIVDEVFPGAAALDTGQALMIGSAARGSTSKYVQINSLTDYEIKMGPRSGGSAMYDAVNAFFSEGGGNLKVSRVAADDALAATVAFGTGLTANAASSGDWGNQLTVKSEAPVPADGAKIVIIVKLSGNEVDRSPKVETPAEAISWSTGRAWVNLAQGAGSGMPSAGTEATLTGGDDGSALAIGDYQAALDRFTFELGPGQVTAPGITDEDVHVAMANHCDDNFRVCMIDLEDGSTKEEIAAYLDGLRALCNLRMTMALGSWVSYPGQADGAVVEQAYSGLQSGIIGRVDRLGDPSLAAAGSNGISRRALGLTQTYTDDERFELNELGVVLAKEIFGQVRTYGYRTAGGPDENNWMFFQESRVIMNLAHRCNAAMEEYVFNTIDGRGHLLAKVNAALVGICMEFYTANALYGETPEDAFMVDTGPGVNPPELVAAGEVHAVVKVKTSRTAEWVVINLVKTPIERSF